MIDLRCLFLPLALSLTLFSCGQKSAASNTERPTAVVTPYSGLSKPASSSKIRITTLQIFAWALNEDQSKSDLHKDQRSSVKSYVEFKQWEVGVLDPDRIDIVCQLENDGEEASDAILELTYDYIVAPVNYPCKANIDTITNEISWSGEVGMESRTVRALAPGERRELKLNDFNLAAVLKDFPGDAKSDYLWLWKFRVHAYIRNGGQKVMEKETNFSVLPRNVRCDN